MLSAQGAAVIHPFEESSKKPAQLVKHESAFEALHHLICNKLV